LEANEGSILEVDVFNHIAYLSDTLELLDDRTGFKYTLIHLTTCLDDCLQGLYSVA